MTQERKEDKVFNVNDLVFFSFAGETHGGEVIGSNGDQVSIRMVRGGKITIGKSFVEKAKYSGQYDIVRSKRKPAFGDCIPSSGGFFFGDLHMSTGEFRVFEQFDGTIKLCRRRVPRVHKREKNPSRLAAQYDEDQ